MVPLHRQIWEGSPYLMALLSIALITWAVWRLAGRWAGILAGCILVCAGPALLQLLLVLNDHAPTWFTLALLGAFLVLLELRAVDLPLWLLIATGVVVGCVLGANAASDVLATLAGAGPFLLAAAITWWLARDRGSARAASIVLASCLLALLVGVLVHAYAHHHNIVAASDARASLFVAQEAVGSNFRDWWQSLVALGNGNFFGLSLGFTSALEFVCAVLTIAGVAVAARVVRRELAGWHARAQSAPAAPRERATIAWCVYWAASLIALSVAFIFSATPEGLPSDRYLVGGILAVAALVPLWARGRVALQVAVSAAVTVYAFAGWLALAQKRIAEPVSPTHQIANEIERIARKEGLTVGYGGCWDAAPITWATHFGVKVFPVDDCDGNQHLCAGELHLITSWYKPRPATRTFLLSDPTYPFPASAPTPDLGAPLAVHQVGPLTMYVYPYDIASRLFALCGDGGAAARGLDVAARERVIGPAPQPATARAFYGGAHGGSHRLRNPSLGEALHGGRTGGHGSLLGAGLRQRRDADGRGPRRALPGADGPGAAVRGRARPAPRGAADRVALARGGRGVL